MQTFLQAPGASTARAFCYRTAMERSRQHRAAHPGRSAVHHAGLGEDASAAKGPNRCRITPVETKDKEAERHTITTFVTSILAFTLSIVVAAVDLSGVWTLSWQPDFGGNDDAYDCNLKQTGQAVTLTCGDNPPITGEVDGEKITVWFK